MGVGAVSIGLSGVAAGNARLRNSAHNLANLFSKDFRSHRTLQIEQQGGGTAAVTAVDAKPQPVDVASEFVQQKLAALQAKSSARAVETALDLQGSLIDILA